MSRKSKGSRSNQKSRFKHYDRYRDIESHLEKSDYREIVERTFDGPPKPKKTIELKPRGKNQENFIKTLENPDVDIVLACGPAGCGKTMLATQFAIKMLQEEVIDRIIITRPTVSVDEDLGFLPGAVNEKLAPWLLPILDVFHEQYSVKEVKNMMSSNVIEIAPIGFLRGRSFKNAVVLIDEAQNCTTNQMKMILTRIGENSKMIITGDLEQHERGFDNNGLKDFIWRMEQKRSKHIEIMKFSKVDIMRHHVIEHVLDLYNL